MFETPSPRTTPSLSRYEKNYTLILPVSHVREVLKFWAPNKIDPLSSFIRHVEAANIDALQSATSGVCRVAFLLLKKVLEHNASIEVLSRIALGSSATAFTLTRNSKIDTLCTRQ